MLNSLLSVFGWPFPSKIGKVTVSFWRMLNSESYSLIVLGRIAFFESFSFQALLNSSAPGILETAFSTPRPITEIPLPVSVIIKLRPVQRFAGASSGSWNQAVLAGAWPGFSYTFPLPWPVCPWRLALPKDLLSFCFPVWHPSART